MSRRYFVTLELTNELTVSLFLPDDASVFDVKCRIEAEIEASQDPRVREAKRISVGYIREAQ